MTTTIKVISHNYPVLVETFDEGKKVYSQVFTPENGEQIFYSTTSREIRVTDLEYDDPRAPKGK